MDFSNVLSKSSPVTRNSSAIFLACYVEESYVTIALWQEDSGRAQVIDIGISKEWQDNQSIIDAIELGIEEFKETENFEKKILFGLPETWVKDGELKSEYKDVLKDISQKLALQPLGYVVNTEAVCQYIYKTDQASSAVLFLNVLSSSLSFYLAENGQVKQREAVGRSDSFPDDIQEALARINQRPLPTKIFFFSEQLQEEQLEEIKNEFLSYNWEEKEVFHHLPTIDVLTRDHLIEAVCIAGGAEAIKAYQQSAELPVISKDPEIAEPVAAALPETNVSEAFDFFEVPAVAESQATAQQPKTFSFGVPIPVIEAEEDDAEELAIDEEQVPENVVQKKRGFSLKLPSISLFKKKEPSAQTSQPPKKSGKKQFLIFIILFIGLFFFALSAFGYYSLTRQTRAEVNVLLNVEDISSKITITLDPDVDQTDAEKNILKVNTIAKDVEGSDEIKTTGSKIIGEKTTGAVTIFNKTQSIKTFSKQTEVKAGDKVYLLDEDVTVASASSKTGRDQVVTLTPGSNSVKITAKAIGANYNLSKDAEFSIANFGKDTYLASNKDDLQNGSSREIQAVAKEDQQKLSALLKKKLQEQGEKELLESAQEGEYIVLNGQVTGVDEEFSAKVGDETTNLKLTMVISVGGYSYKAENLKPIAEAQLASQVPDGAALLEDTLGIQSEQSEDSTQSGRVTLNATLNGQFSPPTNSDQWIEEIKGRTIEQAERILKGKKEIKEVSIAIKPSFSKVILGKMPIEKKDIQLSKRVK